MESDQKWFRKDIHHAKMRSVRNTSHVCGWEKVPGLPQKAFAPIAELPLFFVIHLVEFPAKLIHSLFDHLSVAVDVDMEILVEFQDAFESA